MTPLQETSSPRADSRHDVRSAPALAVVLAGRDAIALRDPLQNQFSPAPVEFATTDTILEAVLIAGSAEDAPDDTPPRPAVTLVVAGVSQELDQLEAAVHSLRKVYPAARIILVC